LNNVATSTFVLEGEGIINEYAGGYDDWLSQRQTVSVPPKAKSSEKAAPSKPQPRKLSFKEEKELASLVIKIQELENRREDCLAAMADPSFYNKPAQDIAQFNKQLEETEDELLVALNDGNI